MVDDLIGDQKQALYLLWSEPLILPLPKKDHAELMDDLGFSVVNDYGELSSHGFPPTSSAAF